MNRNIEEVEANMKTLGISLMQVGGGEERGCPPGVGSQWGLEGLAEPEKTL